MNKSIDKLISISSKAKSDTLCGDLSEFNITNKCLITQLKYLLSKKNGFLAFESALNVFTDVSNEIITNIHTWNRLSGWKSSYSPLVDDVLFFGEDVFANQFGLTNTGIIRFEPESGKISNHSNSIEEWANILLSEYDYETGWSLAKEWQLKNGRLHNNYRLLPKVPFILNGEYETDNLIAVEENHAMGAYGRLYNQIKDLSDGTTTTITNWI